jgi:DNA-binding beta-propeller fold protein YncE
MTRFFAATAIVMLGACAPARHVTATVEKRANVAMTGVTVPMSFDYLAVDRAAGRVFLPLPGAGALEVLDVGTRTVRAVTGFATGEGEWRGRKVKTGPSSATVGKGGFVYVGDHASSEVCAVDTSSLRLGECAHLSSPPDGVAYVAATAEVWVTTPDAAAVTIVDVADPAHPQTRGTVQPGGAPEGYAVDEARGLFFTNLDKGTTLAIDVRTHQIRSVWHPGCNDDGPRGLAFDGARRLLFVACTDHVQVLDAGGGSRAGALRGRMETGVGVDNLDYLPARHLLIAAAGRAATLTVAEVDDGGGLTVKARVPTVKGARNAVLDDAGRAYVPDPAAGALLVLDLE